MMPYSPPRWMQRTKRMALRSTLLAVATMASVSLQGVPSVAAGEVSVTGAVSFESRWHPQSPQHAGQFSGLENSVVFEPEFYYESDDRR